MTNCIAKTAHSENLALGALTIELKEAGIPFVREARLPVRYRDHILPLFYSVDFICYGEILVELKALAAIGPTAVAQLINYLRVARRSRGLLLNFDASIVTSGGAAEPRRTSRALINPRNPRNPRMKQRT